MDQPIIQIRGLTHTYMAGTPMARVSLQGIDLDVAAGEIVALIGPTGSGKSTLLQHINGLIRPQLGQVWVWGQNLGAPGTDLRAIRRRVGLVFQRPGDQLFEQYVGDDVAYGPRLAGLPRPELRERVRWALEQVGLDFDTWRDRLTATLSGGERRRVGIAGVLAMRPQVLLLDEPTASLDPAAHADLIGRLQQFHREGLTLVMATHDMDDVARLADRVYVLHQGRVLLHGHTRQVFAQAEQLYEMGLGLPAASEIARALCENGLPVPVDVLDLDEVERAVVTAIRAREGGSSWDRRAAEQGRTGVRRSQDTPAPDMPEDY